MSASWAAVLVSVVLALAALGREVLNSGQRNGKLDQCLGQLTEIVKDHESRIRVLEANEAALRGIQRPPGVP